MTDSLDDDIAMTRNIELTLLQIDDSIWHEVISQLKLRYNSGFEICISKPEYLKEILGEVCGDHYHEIVNKIVQGLKKIPTNERIESFIKILSE